MANGYDTRIVGHSISVVSAFQSWIMDRPVRFEIIPKTDACQVFRFKVKSKRRRTGMVCHHTTREKFVLVGPATKYWDEFLQGYNP